MQEIKRILERRFKGESQRSIASSLHLSRNTVSKVFKAAYQTGLSWAQFQTMDDSFLMNFCSLKKVCSVQHPRF